MLLARTHLLVLLARTSIVIHITVHAPKTPVDIRGTPPEGRDMHDNWFPWRAEIMDLFTHEQYFWPFYRAYLPDHAERLDMTIRWVTEHGYEPVFFHEGFLGITE